MNIVIVGDGKVGYALSEQLSQEGHSVTIIDSDSKALNDTLESLDVIGVHGNGASLEVQMEAGTPDADLLIAATSSDELNMLCCLIAKHLGTAHTIARVRNPEYKTQLDLLKEQLGLSMVINPELEAARAISRVIKFPPAIRVETFSKGRLELVEYRLREGSPIAGKRLADLSMKQDSKVLICAVDRGGTISIPNGDFRLETGDHIHITGESRNILVFLNMLGSPDRRIGSIMIVGGGKIGYYLATMLDERAFHIKFIEKNADRCNELCDLLPRAVVISGDGSDLELLESEGIDNMDAFIALTGIDEENMIMAMVASRKKVPKVVTKVNRANYQTLAVEMGVDTVISPKTTTASQIAQYVRAMSNTAGGKVKTLHKLLDGKAEAIEFVASQNTPHLSVPLEKLPLKKNLLVAALVRSGDVIIPDGRDSIRLGDSVVIVTNRHRLLSLNDIFEGEAAAR